ncbi:hypothetical protein K438DRAFT_2118689 [Mycena galopus ATCC 62051]|nr:hypothetical protein K438DRAFT_2118689 [Mycena galopus ATCC 62051]
MQTPFRLLHRCRAGFRLTESYSGGGAEVEAPYDHERSECLAHRVCALIIRYHRVLGDHPAMCATVTRDICCNLTVAAKFAHADYTRVSHRSDTVASLKPVRDIGVIDPSTFEGTSCQMLHIASYYVEIVRQLCQISLRLLGYSAEEDDDDHCCLLRTAAFWSSARSVSEFSHFGRRLSLFRAQNPDDGIEHLDSLCRPSRREKCSRQLYALRGLGRARCKRRFVPTVFVNPPYSPPRARMIVALLHFVPRIATQDPTGLFYDLSTKLRPFGQIFAVFVGWHERGQFHRASAPNVGHRAENGRGGRIRLLRFIAMFASPSSLLTEIG